MALGREVTRCLGTAAGVTTRGAPGTERVGVRGAPSPPAEPRVCPPRDDLALESPGLRGKTWSGDRPSIIPHPWPKPRTLTGSHPSLKTNLQRLRGTGTAGQGGGPCGPESHMGLGRVTELRLRGKGRCPAWIFLRKTPNP